LLLTGGIGDRDVIVVGAYVLYLKCIFFSGVGNHEF